MGDEYLPMVSECSKEMKIISWNVNGIRAVERKKALQEFLEEHNPDIFCIQEIKGTVDKFSKFLVENPTYESFYHSAEKPGYAGTGIWIKKQFLESIRADNPAISVSNFSQNFHTGMDNFQDTEGRVARFDFIKSAQKYSILGVYFPNGGKSKEAWEGKLVFYDKFLAYVNRLRKDGRIVLWGGDINCAHEEIDLARPKDNLKSIGFLPQERAWISRCIEENWVDVFRKKFPEKTEVYSWWHVLTKARARNVGWRIDYWFCDRNFYDQLQSIRYLSKQMGSDHCPVEIIC